MKTRSKNRIAEYIASIVVYILLLIFFNIISRENITWLKDSAIVTITLFELSFVAEILGNLILIMYDRGFVKRIIKILLNVISFLPIYALYILYPLDFSKINAPLWTDTLVKIFIILSMMGLIIATIVEIVKIFQKLTIKETAE